MPQPDQNLADGHFAGETHADSHLDHKVSGRVTVLDFSVNFVNS